MSLFLISSSSAEMLKRRCSPHLCLVLVGVSISLFKFKRCASHKDLMSKKSIYFLERNVCSEYIMYGLYFVLEGNWVCPQNFLNRVFVFNDNVNFFIISLSQSYNQFGFFFFLLVDLVEIFYSTGRSILFRKIMRHSHFIIHA